jgi:hypothetical protein
VKTSCTGNTCLKKEIEKTILRILGRCAFSHSLGTKRTWSVWLTMSALEGKAELEQRIPK